MGRLEGKVALVTGAGRGIGRAVALAFGREGADVVVNYSKSEQGAREVVEEIEGMRRKAIACKADVSKEDEVVAMFKTTLDTFGKLDILVSNAGSSAPGMLHKMSLERWDAVLDVHLKGAFLCTREAAKHMMEKKSGKIIYVSSIGGSQGTVGQINYGAAKGGLFGLMRSAAKELAPYNINVNAICPGVIETDMTKTVRSDPKFREITLGRILFRRFATPEEIAPTFVFLASSDADYIHGQAIFVDGGMAGLG